MDPSYARPHERAPDIIHANRNDIQIDGGKGEGADHLPLLLTADRAAAELGLHRRTVYAEIRGGRLDARRYGRRVLIPREALAEFAANLDSTA